MSKPEDAAFEPDLDKFAGEVTHEPADWRWLWQSELEGSLGGHQSWLERLLSLPARLVAKVTGADERRRRQVRFNLVVLALLENIQSGVDELGQDVQRVQADLVADLGSVRDDLVTDLAKLNSDLKDTDRALAEFKKEGLADLSRQTEALFSILDQKLDRVRKDS